MPEKTCSECKHWITSTAIWGNCENTKRIESIDIVCDDSEINEFTTIEFRHSFGCIFWEQ